jgi:hypothetical protein
MTERVVNLTPHAIHVGDRTIPPSGAVARVSTASVAVGKHDGIPIVRTNYGQVEGLPEPEEGTLYVVSSLVRLACPDRADLASPALLVRDQEGRVIGCGALEV